MIKKAVAQKALWAFLTVAVLSPSLSQAQPPGRGGSRFRFDPTRILERIDRNDDGILQPDEMDGRARGFIERLAGERDLSKPIPIKELAEAIEERRRSRDRDDDDNRDRDDRDRDRRDRDRDDRGRDSRSSSEKQEEPLVPGFGTQTEEEAPMVPGFGVEAAAGQPNLEAEYGERVVEYVEERLLERYDKNKSGALEREEWESVPWGSDPNESDANRDGVLSKAELAARTQQRWSSRSRGGRSSWSRRSSSSSSRDSDNSSSPNVDGRIRRYAESLLKQYDKNKNGVLEKDEWSRMRGSPSEADRNGDGVLTQDELAVRLANYSRRSGSSRSSSRTSSGPSYSSGPRVTKGNGKSYRFTTTAERLPKGLPSWFTRSDADGDGQVMMHEYASVWSSSKVSEFTKYDLNRDGVVTPEECLQAEKKR